MISLNRLFIKTIFQSNQYGYYIHLKDHNKKINPQKNRLSLSYMNPKIVKQGAPQQPQYLFNLRRKTQKQLQKKMFQEYKQKVLKGQIDQDQQVQIDPLWGEDQKPKHYYQNLSKNQLMTVSYSQNSQFIQKLNQTQSAYFITTLKELPTMEEIKKMTPNELVICAVYARNNNITQGEFWFNLQKTIGNKFYQLDIDELIKLNYSVRGVNKKGTPRLHQILRDLLDDEMPKMNKNQLIALFYSLQHAKLQGVKLQDKILNHLQPFYKQMSFTQKVDWLFIYTMCRRPQTYKKAHQKTLHQSLIQGHKVIFNLNLPTSLIQHLCIQSSVKLLYSLSKLRARNTRFITDDIITYLKQHIQQIKQNLDIAYKILYYSQQVQGGIGIYDESLFNQLISILTLNDNFVQLNKHQQIKTIYAIWNYNLMTDDIFELYKSIQIDADSTLLHYFNQIQLSRSSQREWQILRCTAQLQSIPLPYYQSFKRFYNYMKATTEWDLTPIQQKLINTEYYFDVIRGKDKFYHVRLYKNLQKYVKFTGQMCPFQNTVPIDNVEIVQFSNTRYQVSIDILKEEGFVPGKDQLKESYRNKIRSLTNIGWKHVVLREKQVTKLSADQQITQILGAYQEYKEEQEQVIANRDYYRAEVIQNLRTQDYWNGMIAEEAEGYRNNPEEYARKVAQLAEKEKKLSEDLAKQDL